MMAGGLAGIAGAYLSVGQIGLFVVGMSGGRGYLAIAAVIFGAWRPGLVLAASLFFGATDALQLRLQAVPGVPREVWLVLALVTATWLVVSVVHRRMAVLSLVALGFGGCLLVIWVLFLVLHPAVKPPADFLIAAPYVFALAALAGVGGRVQAPRALTVPFRRGGPP